MSRDFTRDEEERDDAYAGLAQSARDHGLDLEQERADVNPIEICGVHGVHIPLLSGDCAACLDADDAVRDAIRNRFDPTRPIYRPAA